MMKKFRIQGGYTYTSILSRPNLQIEMKARSAQNTAFDQVHFCIRKIIWKWKCKVYILIWQIIISALKKKKHYNKQRPNSILGGKSIFAIQRFFIGKDFPLVFKGTFIFRPCSLHLERG